MSLPWRKYQQEVADLFCSLGFSVEVEKDVEGARGIHEVDVLARTTFAGVGVTWVIECKLWKAAVPKEKVLALAQVASDVGADRAFLLSESGFQAGAIRVAENTNITLTSLPELLESARDALQQRKLLLLKQKAYRLQRALHDLCILDDGSAGLPAGIDWDTFSSMLSSVFEISSLALPRVEACDFPVRIDTGACAQPLPDVAAFIAYAAPELERVGAWLATCAHQLAEQAALPRSPGRA